MSLWDDLTIEDLNEDEADLARAIGLENAKKVFATFGGEGVYYRTPETLIRSMRNRKIYIDSKRMNLRELKQRYDLGTRHLREIIREQHRMHTRPVKQELLFEDV